MFENLNDFLAQLDQLKSLQGLLTSGKVTKNEDGELEFSDGETTLKLSSTDNGFKVSLVTEHFEDEENYEQESEEVLIRREFERFCDTIDDETFEQTCNKYSEHFTSIKELNDNLNKTSIKNFISCLQDICKEETNKYETYFSDSNIYLKSL